MSFNPIYLLNPELILQPHIYRLLLSIQPYIFRLSPIHFFSSNKLRLRSRYLLQQSTLSQNLKDHPIVRTQNVWEQLADQ